ncbi:MAG: hypothetical protein HY658_13595 [Actinobacteria bacterium]|nr:hypothetical protein [Actinomycetota bacterium]
MFRWTYLDASGREVGASDPFADRGEAEAWMSHAWQDLLDEGVAEVVLVDLEEDEGVYRMPLGEASEGHT